MKAVKFFLGKLAGFGFTKSSGYMAEVELNEEEEIGIYEDEFEYPLFV